jgi:hypothetical protein
MDFFRGRLISIITKHHKEQVMGAAFSKIPGLSWALLPDADTDVLGTFTGEIARAGTQREACIKKIALGSSKPGVDLLAANEGAFGPHPAIPFAQADIELVMLYDAVSKQYWEAWEVSSDTNAFSVQVKSPAAGLEIAKKHGFPEYGMVVLCKSDAQVHVVKKGIHDKQQLMDALFEAMNLKKGDVYLEADLRAMHNPGRMKVIEKATQKLVENLMRECPSCSFPGYAVQEIETGLPCEWCGGETEGIKNYIYRCKSCGFSEKKPGEKTAMEAMYCPFCNP